MASSAEGEVRLLENGLLDASPIESTKRITQRNWEQSPFLNLPAEIRNRIYEYALTTKPIICIEGSDTSSVYMSTHDYHMQFRSSRHRLPKFYCLQQVCRAIYAETALLPFSLNNFQFRLERLEYDSQYLLPAQVEAIRAVFCTTDRWRTPDIQTHLPDLEAFKGLKRMIWCPTVGPWKPSSIIEAQKDVLEEKLKSCTSREVKVTIWSWTMIAHNMYTGEVPKNASPVKCDLPECFQ